MTTLAVRNGAFGRATVNRLGRALAPHAHREGHVIVTLRGRGGAIHGRDAAYPLAEGHAVLIDPWSPHRFAPGPGPESTFLTLYIEPDWFAARRRATLSFGAPCVAMTPALSTLAREVAAMLASDGGAAALDRALAALAGGLHRLSHRVAPAGRGARGVGDFRIRRAVRLLRDGVVGGTDAKLDAVAREAGLSRPHFYKMFQEEMGVTPGTFVNALKMERSYDRLARTEDTVTAIALDLGFASQASFTRFFIAQSGMAPTAYRQALARDAGRKETVRYA